MSRRYGRNQKRRARERMAALEADVTRMDSARGMSEALARDAFAQRDRSQDELRRVMQALGPNFIGLSPVEAAFSAVPAREDQFRMLAPDDSIATMHMLKINTVDWGNSVACMMHVRARLAGGESAYALSARAIADTPAEVLAHHLSRELALYLLEALRRNGARR